jgi:dienelactone hydrolase
MRVSRWLVWLLVIGLLAGALPAVAQERDPETIAQAVVDNLLAGDYAAASADFDAAMQQLLPVESLEQSWLGVLAQVGAFEAQLGVTTEPVADSIVVFITLQFERAVLDAQVSIDAAGAVNGLRFRPSQSVVAVAHAVIDNLAAGDYAAAAADFDAAIQTTLPAERLAEVWQTLVDEGGAFVRKGDVQTQLAGDYLVVTIVLEFEQAMLDATISLNADGQVAGLYFQVHQPVAPYAPPAYADPAAFDEQDVILNAGTDWELPGTLTLPQGEGPFPAVVLVHGSGPQDRDESIEANKPFKDLAWGLASQGIAVLRYDKRTLVHQQRMILSTDATVDDETVDDALAAAAWLRASESVDPARVFVVGHSQGGYLAPRMVQRDPSLAGAVILAGNARPLPTLALEQTNYLLSLDGDLSETDQVLIAQLEPVIEATLNAQPDSDPATLLFNAPATYWIDLNAYDPVATAAETTPPLLILQGERDYQVTMVDFELWQSGLSGRAGVTFTSYPGLNHLFISGTGPSTPAEYQQPGNVSEAVITDIVNWIAVH